LKDFTTGTRLLKTLPLFKKIDAFTAESEMLSALQASIFHTFFTNSENATKSKFRQETLNILSE
jgi:hypothetical protein